MQTQGQITLRNKKRTSKQYKGGNESIQMNWHVAGLLKNTLRINKFFIFIFMTIDYTWKEMNRFLKYCLHSNCLRQELLDSQIDGHTHRTHNNTHANNHIYIYETLLFWFTYYMNLFEIFTSVLYYGISLQNDNFHLMQTTLSLLVHTPPKYYVYYYV